MLSRAVGDRFGSPACGCATPCAMTEAPLYCHPIGGSGIEDEKCVCRVNWVGSACDTNRLYVEPNLWETFLAVQNITLPIGNILILIHAAIVLINKIKEGRKTALPAIASIAIILGCISRGVEIIDPLCWRGIVNCGFENFMTMTAYAFWLFGYAIVISFWLELLTMKARVANFKRARNVALIGGIVWFCIVEAAVLVQWLAEMPAFFYVVNGITGATLLAICIITPIFGYLMWKRLHAFSVTNWRSKRTAVKVTRFILLGDICWAVFLIAQVWYTIAEREIWSYMGWHSFFRLVEIGILFLLLCLIGHGGPMEEIHCLFRGVEASQSQTATSARGGTNPTSPTSSNLV